jgi:hypothetical protein
VTISSSAGAQLTITQICLRAYQGAGLRSVHQGTADLAWEAEFAYARDRLGILVDELAVYGVMARAASFVEQTLTAGTYKYSMAPTVLDVVGMAMYIDAAEKDKSKAASETSIDPISREHWTSISSKSASGTPTMYYAHRELDQIEVRLWPVPDEAGTVRFQVHRKLSDTTDGNATLDLEEYWLSYVITALESKLMEAASMPLSVYADRRNLAALKLAMAVGKANERPGPSFRLDHQVRVW